jgi:phosphoserine phosphatase RsbU/P
MSLPPTHDWHRRSSDPETRVEHVLGRVRSFWERMTEGLEVEQLWSQFHADARAGYQLYAKEVDWAHVAGESRGRRAFRIARALFWAMVMKLTPPRRVLLLIAFAFLLFPDVAFVWGDTRLQIGGGAFRFLGVLGLFVLLVLELADRVIMKRDLEIAREIQQWLIPPLPPQIPGVDIAFAMRPANTVAGDYYDAFLRPSTDGRKAEGAEPGTSAPANRLLLAVADVAGKSVPAALLMATFQASLRTLAAAAPSSLVELVDGLNRYACAHSLGGLRFTTAFLTEFDPASGTLTSINAGHNAPVVRRRSGAIERLETGGLPLGIRSGASYESASTTLHAGDLLVVFTDGVVEAENEKQEEFGEPRLLELVRGMHAGSAAQSLGVVMASVDAFVGSARQHDDVTCLVMWVL